MGGGGCRCDCRQRNRCRFWLLRVYCRYWCWEVVVYIHTRRLGRRFGMPDRRLVFTIICLSNNRLLLTLFFKGSFRKFVISVIDDIQLVNGFSFRRTSVCERGVVLLDAIGTLKVLFERLTRSVVMTTTTTRAPLGKLCAGHMPVSLAHFALSCFFDEWEDAVSRITQGDVLGVVSVSKTTFTFSDFPLSHRAEFRGIL